MDANDEPCDGYAPEKGVPRKPEKPRASSDTLADWGCGIALAITFISIAVSFAIHEIRSALK